MPSVAFIAMAGFRVRERELAALGMSMPGLHDRAQAVAALPSLGLLTLAGMTPATWDVHYFDPYQVTDDLIAQINRLRPTIIAISALTASIEEAYELSDLLRGEGHQVILGGLHVTSCPQEAMQHADAIVVGDGESVWPAILQNAQARQLRPMYRIEVGFDLARSSVPRFDLANGHARARFTLQTARGCPLACDFCAASRLLGPFREKPLPNIEQELIAIRSVEPRPIVELADDNTFAGRRSAQELLDLLQRHEIRYFTECDWRIGERPEILDRLADSGCVQVLIGFESLVHEHPGMGSKRAALARMMDAATAIQDAGVCVIGCFVVGSDGEDFESLQRLCEVLIDAPLADIQLTLQTAFPGTALHERLKREGRLLADRSWSHYTLFDVTHEPDRLTVEQLERGFQNLVKCIFAAEPTRRRREIRRHIWGSRWTENSQ